MLVSITKWGAQYITQDKLIFSDPPQKKCFHQIFKYKPSNLLTVKFTFIFAFHITETEKVIEISLPLIIISLR